MAVQVLHGDCLEVLRGLEDCSVDAIVTDPPYGLSNTKPAQVADVLKAWVTGDTVSVPAKRGGFMGKDWDSFVPPPAVWEECMRVLKPGGHMAVFAGSRTQDLMGLSVRLAGFEIRDTLGWIYGSGFPKSHDIGKAIDRQRQKSGDVERFSSWLTAQMEKRGINRQELDEVVGSKSKGNLSHHWTTHPTQRSVPPAEMWGRMFHLFDPLPEWAEPLIMPARKPGEAWEKREVVGKYQSGLHTGPSGVGGNGEGGEVTISHSDAAKQWDGWGTALKPAIEPIILARKPLVGTVAANVLAHGVGGLNIDACRVGMSDADREAAKVPQPVQHNDGRAVYQMGTGEGRNGATFEPAPAGRFPANVLLDEHAAKEMDKQSGILKSGALNTYKNANRDSYSGGMPEVRHVNAPANSGGASRFFPVFKYQAKAPKKERPVIEREAICGLRDDLTEDQVDYVLARLREAGVETG